MSFHLGPPSANVSSLLSLLLLLSLRLTIHKLTAKENIVAYWHSYDNLQKHPPEVFCKKIVLKNFAKIKFRKNTCDRAILSIKLQAQACNFIKKRLWHRVFSCEFCEIFKNTFFYSTSLLPLLNLQRWFWNEYLSGKSRTQEGNQKQYIKFSRHRRIQTKICDDKSLFRMVLMVPEAVVPSEGVL